MKNPEPIGYFAECYYCDTVFSFWSSERKELVRNAKRHGWKLNDTVGIMCPECSKKDNPKMKERMKY